MSLYKAIISRCGHVHIVGVVMNLVGVVMYIPIVLSPESVDCERARLLLRGLPDMKFFTRLVTVICCRPCTHNMVYNGTSLYQVILELRTHL